MKLRSFVSIGEHHKGPHVDALMALAERCGAIVLRVPVAEPEPAPKGQPRRAPYAGKSEHDYSDLSGLWGEQ